MLPYFGAIKAIWLANPSTHLRNSGSGIEN